MNEIQHSKAKEAVGSLLLEWWGKNKRKFSWRHRKDPYAVLIAEMLLRKTTAKQVEKIYHDFIKKFPSPKVLSKVDENELKEMLTPLGMEHNRAELFIKFGRAVVDDFSGMIPFTEKELLKLPGVGLYAANAVLSFSYSKNVPMVDTNFIRVIRRVFDFTSSKTRARNDSRIWQFAGKLIPDGKSREFNLSVLDFAATVCKHRDPECETCPLASICAFYRKDRDSESRSV